jgi:3-deoxy-D-arabino-heptulosonate 7-phosphate (DAHP) synthase class II
VVKNIFFEKRFLVVWKYAKMHQNTFVTAPDSKNISFEKKFLLVGKYVEMHQNTLLTTPSGKKYLF